MENTTAGESALPLALLCGQVVMNNHSCRSRRVQPKLRSLLQEFRRAVQAFGASRSSFVASSLDRNRESCYNQCINQRKVFLMAEPRPKLQKALRVFAVFLLIFSIASFVIVTFTFVTSFFIGGQILSDGSGIMSMLLRPKQHGKLAIDSALFGFAWMPGLGEVTVFFAYCCVLLAALRRRKKHGPEYPGALQHRAALCVLAALTIALPMVLWPVSAPIVAKSGTFSQPFPTPLPGMILLACTLVGVLLAPKPASTAAPEEKQPASAENPMIRESDDMRDSLQQDLNRTEDNV